MAPLKIPIAVKFVNGRAMAKTPSRGTTRVSKQKPATPSSTRSIEAALKRISKTALAERLRTDEKTIERARGGKLARRQAEQLDNRAKKFNQSREGQQAKRESDRSGRALRWDQADKLPAAVERLNREYKADRDGTLHKIANKHKIDFVTLQTIADLHESLTDSLHAALKTLRHARGQKQQTAAYKQLATVISRLRNVEQLEELQFLIGIGLEFYTVDQWSSSKS